ncbi:phage head-tail connector protein [Macrococcus sp. DPC7161]|uniref:phage head-tail connector protein n=1 Tax=Macrococcus sp. DPC7161 TaxID=2507060 RepID=UPI00100B5029|nr:phage head-tail connector protein [Macrococcus sp. DPC7161]RXK19090.1 phage head-tail connector protein [Macrococcus sp. DPC7161]
MATLNNVKLQLGITDDKQDDLLNLIIANVEKAMLLKLTTVTSVPTELSYITEEVAIARYYRRGSEGMKSKTVEGFSVSYDDEFNKYADVFERYQVGSDDFTAGQVTFF